MVRGLLLWVMIMSFFTSCQKNKIVFNETQQENFFLQSGLVFFQKTYNQSLNFPGIENELTSINSPNSGIQIKFNDGEVIRGVIINHQIDWQKGNTKKLSVPKVMKYPINANFQLEKDKNGYKVTVQDFWFSETQKNKNNNIELESLWVQKNRFSFRKDKNTIKNIHYLSHYFSKMFNVRGITQENRF